MPNSVDLKIWKQLDPHTNRLTRLRVEKARKKYRGEVEAETRQIRFDNRGNANSMAIPYALLRMQLKKAHEVAEQQYSIFRDVWLRLGGVESAAFIRTISWMVIQTVAKDAEKVRRRELVESYNGIKRRDRARLFSVAADEWLVLKSLTLSTSSQRIERDNLKHLRPHFERRLVSDI